MSTKKQYAYFSAAIRDGAKLRPQSFVTYWDDSGTCALGAGLHAMYQGDKYADMGLVSIFQKDMLALFPYMNNVVQCPARAKWWQLKRLVCICRGSYGQHSLVKTLEHLNDFHGWTREQIADWLYAEEEKLGFVTLTVEPDTGAGRGDSNVTKDCQASFPEKVFV